MAVIAVAYIANQIRYIPDWRYRTGAAIGLLELATVMTVGGSTTDRCRSGLTVVVTIGESAPCHRSGAIHMSGGLNLGHIAAGGRVRIDVTLIACDGVCVTMGRIQVGFVCAYLRIGIIVNVAIGIAIIGGTRCHTVAERAIARGANGRPRC